MELPLNNTTKFFADSGELAQYVFVRADTLKSGCRLTMIIEPEKYEGFSARIATDTLLDEYVDRKAWPYLEQLQLI